ncbi:MAG: hypothetical protein P4L70_04615 [Parasulfuritortus sp.]|nr:hypothetical protein [Parasulfuritortus sp.]
MKPNREFIQDALASVIVDPRTRALYELCFMHRHHFQDDIVADKLRMMVRVCVEQGLLVNDFSAELVAHRLGRSGIDRWFASLATAEHLDLALVFELHKRVMDVFSDLPEMQARSLAAKYLHYHFPELFYIYDAGLETAAFDLGEGECGYLARAEHDPIYGAFFSCCRKLADKLAPLAGHRLSPRELDLILRAWRDRTMTRSTQSSDHALAA